MFLDGILEAIVNIIQTNLSQQLDEVERTVIQKESSTQSSSQSLNYSTTNRYRRRKTGFHTDGSPFLPPDTSSSMLEPDARRPIISKSVLALLIEMSDVAAAD